MKCAVALAAIMAALVVPAVAQRGGAHGGGTGGRGVSAPHSFSPGRGGSAPRGGGFVPGGGGFSSRGPIGVRPSPGPRVFSPGLPMGARPGAPRGFNYSGGLISGRATAPGRFGSTRLPYDGFSPSHAHGPGHHRGYGPGGGDHGHHHRGIYWGGSVYPYYPWYYTGPIFTGYVDPWLFGPDDYYGYGYDNPAYGYGGDVPAPYRDYGMQNSQPGPAEYYQQNPGVPAGDSEPQQSYMPQNQPAASPSSPGAAASERPVTLIFNDGRPPVQIHNYLLTASTLTVLDPQYREIPLDKINIAATEQTNRAVGVDFRVPVKR